MAIAFSSLSDLLAHGFDDVIDVRSPAEFAEDHLSGALSMPVLDNDERAEVGTIYVQQSPFLARKIGAAKVFRNASNHIDRYLAQKDGGWRPLVYCWRGGQRSGSFAWMLQQIGWRAELLDGGYRSYRRLVNAMLYDRPLGLRLVALDGYTGTAKTDLLKLAAERGAQVLDLEGAAGHRGSLLGARPEGQPSQKSFESNLAMDLCRFDPSRPVLIEAESNKIGTRIIPPSLWRALKDAPRIRVSAGIEARTRYLQRAYDDILSDGPRLRDLLDHLRSYRGHALVESWHGLIASGDKAGLTRALMEQHYDPSYATSQKVVGAPTIAQVDCGALDDASLAEAADRIVELLDQDMTVMTPL